MTATIGVITFPGTLDDVDAIRAVRNGGAELVDEINEKGFSSLKED